jgi:dTDP-4-dehydrorhamnose reductase
MVKVLVTGATGMLGVYVCEKLQKTPYEVILADRKQFDLKNPGAVFSYVTNLKPDVVLHLAAETNVDLCEVDPQIAGVCNHLSTVSIAKASELCGAWILYVSTSNVFGSRGSFEYNEIDEPAPMNYYGRSKLMGEYAIKQYCPVNHLIVRAGWMIGGGINRDHKFVGQLIKKITNDAGEIKVVGDKFGSLTSASSLSKFVVWAMDARISGTYHYSSKGTITRFSIAQALARLLKKDVNLTLVKSSEFPLSAPRPFSEGLCSIYTPLLSSAPQPGNWDQDLAEYVSQFFVTGGSYVS